MREYFPDKIAQINGIAVFIVVSYVHISERCYMCIGSRCVWIQGTISAR